jgi:serine protease
LLSALAPDARAQDIQTALLDSARAAPFATPDAQGHDVLYGFGIVDPLSAMEQLVPTRSDAGVPGDAQGDGASSDGGCSCRVRPAGSFALAPALALGLLVLTRVRRRR